MVPTIAGFFLPRNESDKTITEPLPPNISIKLGNMIFCRKERLTRCVPGSLDAPGRIQNPELYQAQAMRLSTFGKRRVIAWFLAFLPT